MACPSWGTGCIGRSPSASLFLATWAPKLSCSSWSCWAGQSRWCMGLLPSMGWREVSPRSGQASWLWDPWAPPRAGGLCGLSLLSWCMASLALWEAWHLATSLLASVTAIERALCWWAAASLAMLSASSTAFLSWQSPSQKLPAQPKPRVQRKWAASYQPTKKQQQQGVPNLWRAAAPRQYPPRNSWSSCCLWQQSSTTSLWLVQWTYSHSSCSGNL